MGTKYKDISNYPAETPGLGKTVPGEVYEFDETQSIIADAMPHRFEKVKGPGRPSANQTVKEGNNKENLK